MATYTTVSIINTALVLCGATTVSTLTDDTPNARALNTVYELARKSILCENCWTFATSRSTLATSATLTISTFGWDYDDEAYVYDRPTAALRIFDVSDKAAMWREEGSYIVSDTNELGVKYVTDHSEVGLWPPTFVSAFIDKLCADISFMILNSATKAQAFLEKYEKASLPAARSANSQTGTHQTPNDDEWLGSKYYNGGGSGNQARSFG